MIDDRPDFRGRCGPEKDGPGTIGRGRINRPGEKRG